MDIGFNIAVASNCFGNASIAISMVYRAADLTLLLLLLLRPNTLQKKRRAMAIISRAKLSLRRSGR